MNPLNFKKVYIWHLSGARWEAAYDKCSILVDSIKNAHEKFLKKRYNIQSKRKNRPGFIRNLFTN